MLDKIFLENSRGVIELPWRAFRAYHQLYSLETFNDTLGLSRTKISLFRSTASNARLHVQLLLKKGVIVASRGEYRLSKGFASYGYQYQHETPSILVYPGFKSENGRAWVQSRGHCSFCGSKMTLFGKDGLGKMPRQSMSLMKKAWSCKTCQTIKKNHALEDFRWLMSMRDFEHDNGIRFSHEQISYLEEKGMSEAAIGLAPYDFYFEQLTIDVL